jgi:hypothetical protein
MFESECLDPDEGGWRHRRMTKQRRRTTRVKGAAAPKAAADCAVAPHASEEEQIVASNLSLHDLFQQQTMAMLARTDLDEETKQNVLIAMSCPCCGAGAMAFTAKLVRGS